MVRRWSVCGWPTVFAAMSERMRSAGPPSASLSRSGAASSMKSISRMVAPSIGSVGSRSMPTIARLGRLQPHHLGPAAGRDAEVDHLSDALEEAEPLVELDQLVGGARAIALGLGAPDIGIVQLPLEPAGRADACGPWRCVTRLRGPPPARLTAPAAVGRAAHRLCAVAGHQRAQDAFADAAVGDAERLGRPDVHDRLEDRAAGDDQVGALVADAGEARRVPHGSCFDSVTLMSRIAAAGICRPSTARRS